MDRPFAISGCRFIGPHPLVELPIGDIAQGHHGLLQRADVPVYPLGDPGGAIVAAIFSVPVEDAIHVLAVIKAAFRSSRGGSDRLAVATRSA